MQVQVDVLSPRENQWEVLNLVGIILCSTAEEKFFRPGSVLEMIRDAGDDHAAFEEQRAFQ